MKKPSNLELTITDQMLYGLIVEQTSKPSFVGQAYNICDMKVNPHNAMTFIGKKPYRVLSHKPYLFALSCLTEEITIDGKTFVPIVELAKIGEPEHFSEINIRASHKPDIYGVSFISKVMKDVAVAFMFLEKERSFFVACDLKIPMFVFDEQGLFDKLHEWHFNTRGLQDHEFINAKETGCYS